MILILGNMVQFSQPVVDELELYGKEVIFFETSRMLDGESIVFNCIGGQPQLLAKINGMSINLNDAEAVWFWKPMLVKELRTSSHARYINMQYWKIWESIASILKDRIWISDYYKMTEAENKPYQLQIASEVGFTIPDTVITSDPEMARNFWQHCNHEMVMKQLALLPKDDKVIFTVKVTEEIMSKAEQLRVAPVILQKMIAKKTELRITVVGNEIFAASVSSDDKVDWRKSVVTLKKTDLPGKIRDNCLSLVSSLGLRYGCIDMIVSPDGEYHFLEINPNGQWGFVEQKTGLPISKAIAKLLLGQ